MKRYGRIYKEEGKDGRTGGRTDEQKEGRGDLVQPVRRNVKRVAGV